MPAEGENRILTRMLERLYAAIAGGPGLNCRPHSSRQRMDFAALGRIGGCDPAAALSAILGEDAAVKVTGSAPPTPEPAVPAEARDASAARVREAWREQQAVFSKLRVIAEEARTYEQDTGSHVLSIGFPLLSLPPGAGPVSGLAGAPTGRRILAPIAFVPVSVEILGGARPAVQIACVKDEVERVIANEALMAWIERLTGRAAPESFDDEQDNNPWAELGRVVRHVAAALSVPVPEEFGAAGMPSPFDLRGAPRADDAAGAPAVILGAVIGLFPAANQGMLRDTRAMLDGEPVHGPVSRFLRAEAIDPERAAAPEGPKAGADGTHHATRERPFLVVPADPCQASAVAHARTSDGLVIHGPPGTGKSQTITNIIADHLIREQRVLFVCDKRTALDVVANRLEHLGLGSLCALVHDPKRDQRELYRSIRDQIEGLADAKPASTSHAALTKLDAELGRIHDELRSLRDGLLGHAGGGGDSLHSLVGAWLGIDREDGAATDGRDDREIGISADAAACLDEATLEDRLLEIGDLLRRSAESGGGDNPWSGCCDLPLETFLARPMPEIRAALATCRALAEEVGAIEAGGEAGGIPVPEAVDLSVIAVARESLAEAIEKACAVPAPVRAAWSALEHDRVRRSLRLLDEARPQRAALAGARADLELAAAAPPGAIGAPQHNEYLSALEAYLEKCRAWYGFLLFGRTEPARRALAPLGLPLTAASAERARLFYSARRTALLLRAVLDQVAGHSASAAGIPVADAESTEELFRAHERLADVWRLLVEDPALAGLEGLIGPAMGGADTHGALRLAGVLRRSAVRCRAVIRLAGAMDKSELFGAPWTRRMSAAWCGGGDAAAAISALEGALPTLEDVLRIRAGLSTLAAPLATAVRELIARGVSADSGRRALRRAFLAGHIGARLKAVPALRTLDPRRIESLFARWGELHDQRRRLVRDAVLHRWQTRQRDRLLVGTASRLNSMGADMRRRLTSRGERALRLRQVIELGERTEGGDPLLDLRPVWMASPETVAQVLPRRPVFDVVIFDEASQCRLEEALPVLLRARRFVIAGDPKQLPPSRFFETGLVASETEEIGTDQDLFETQQREVEDLLSAALNLDLHRCYLDVHYRSRNADLVEFSNAQFYDGRLQPIPAHPCNRVRHAPITLVRADGVYKDRTNPAEADRVCRIVHDLLRRADPPSIGIACFNLAQRDLISERLDERAQEDPEFGARLAVARQRRGEGAFEGLFVKNLENVQGDERDHIIISTTYGPDESGRFYRRFGPLAQPGGGRRLNVLVTRARREVHIVTSIPSSSYLALPPIPDGQAAGGAWLLFAYLQYAEQLAASYAAAGGERSPDGVVDTDPAVTVGASRWPSAVAEALGSRLAIERRTGGHVYWGNEGFRVDIALAHPERPADVSIGLLCDFARFEQGVDPIEWDMFRDAVLRSQGWTLHRVWSPSLFRDAKGCVDALLARADEVVRARPPEDALRVGAGPDQNR